MSSSCAKVHDSLGHALLPFFALRRADFESTGVSLAAADVHLHQVEFAEGTKLYVPIAKIDLVQKYVGGGKEAPVLSKIGSSTWEKRKKRVAEAVVDLAQELLDIHAQRASQPALLIPPRTATGWPSSRRPFLSRRRPTS